MMTAKLARFQLRERHFFLAVLPIAVAIEWAFAASQDWQAYPRSEWVALVDLCLFMPLLYLGFFSSKFEMKLRIIRAIGIAGIGLLATRYLVPEANQFVTSYLAQMRNAVLAFVILFEGFVLYKLIQAVYRRNADAKELERDFAMPAWIAKLMVLEARFWKAVWNLFKRK